MKKLSFPVSRQFLALVALIIVALVIWFVGPLVAFGGLKPLAGAGMRVFLIALLLAGVLLWLCRQVDERHIRSAAVPADLVCGAAPCFRAGTPFRARISPADRDRGRTDSVHHLLGSSGSGNACAATSSFSSTC
jgi:hypothetical protein